MKEKMKVRRFKKYLKRRVTAKFIEAKTRNFQLNGRTVSKLLNKKTGKMENKEMCETCFVNYALYYKKCSKCLNAEAEKIRKEHGLAMAEFYLGRV